MRGARPHYSSAILDPEPGQPRAKRQAFVLGTYRACLLERLRAIQKLLSPPTAFFVGILRPIQEATPSRMCRGRITKAREFLVHPVMAIDPSGYR